MKSTTADRLNLAGSIASLVGLAISLVLLAIGYPRISAQLAVAFGLLWGAWVTASIIAFKRQLVASASSVEVALPTPKLALGDGVARRVDSKNRKFRISAEILTLDTATIVFWVRLDEEIANSTHNRYLFSYTTDSNDESGHPNSFYLVHQGGTNTWKFKFFRRPDQNEHNSISFANGSNTLGTRMFTIRWCAREGWCDLLIDAGSAFRKRAVVDDWDSSWPKPGGGDIDIGGWRDNWDGGLSRALFMDVRIFDSALTDTELAAIFSATSDQAQRLLGRSA